MRFEGRFEPGDRVRICKPRGEYTGCRGTIAARPGRAERNVAPLGYFVAIDGENGVSRPFLVADLELLEATRVRRTDPHRHDAPARRSGGELIG